MHAKIDSIGLEILKERVPRISAVTKYGFVYRGCSTSPATKALPEAFEFRFRKEDLNLEIVLLPAEGCIGAFVVEISKENQVESLNFSQWLKTQGDESWLEKFRLSNYSGGIEGKIDSFVVFLESLFEKPKIKSVLNGELWVDTPFDWGPNR